MKITSNRMRKKSIVCLCRYGYLPTPRSVIIPFLDKNKVEKEMSTLNPVDHAELFIAEDIRGWKAEESVS